MRRVLLDTSAYSAVRRGHREIREALQVAEQVYVNPVVLGELRAGFRRGARPRENERHLERFLGSPRVDVVEITEATSEYYALILNDLWQAGTPIPTNDIWIAASAMEHGLRLLTTDTHYQRVRQVAVTCFEVSGEPGPAGQ